MIDGAGHFKIYFRIMLPQARPIFGALFLTQWLSVWNSYESAMIYLPDLPTLPVGIYQFYTEMMYRARFDILFAAPSYPMITGLSFFLPGSSSYATIAQYISHFSYLGIRRPISLFPVRRKYQGAVFIVMPNGLQNVSRLHDSYRFLFFKALFY